MKKLIIIPLILISCLSFSQQTGKTQLKTYFQTGDKPSQAEFYRLIDSYFNYADDDIKDIPGFPNVFGENGKVLMTNGSIVFWDSATNKGLQIDSIYSISDTLFFVTDSGTFKMGRELGGSGTTDTTGLSNRIARDSTRIDSIVAELADTVSIEDVEFDSLTAIKMKMDTLKVGDFYIISNGDSMWVANPANTWQSRLDSIVGGGTVVSNDTTITLLDNTTGGNINIGQVGYSYHWNYEISRGANWRTGNLVASGYSTTVIYDKGTYIESTSIGVTINSFNISGGQIRLNYTTTNTGSNATMTLTRLSKL